MPSTTIQAQSLTQKAVNILIDKAIKKFNIPAMAVVVMNADDLLLLEAKGVRIVNTNNAVAMDDYFHIGSCAKSILAIMAGKLIEQGKLQWHTKLFDVFHELRETSNPAYYAVTLEDLFICEAGILPFTGVEEFPVIDSLLPDKRKEFVRWLLKQPPAAAAAGNRFKHLYSNAGYTIVACMLEQVSGLSWEGLIKETLQAQYGYHVLFGWPNSNDTSQPWGHGGFTYDVATKTEQLTPRMLHPMPPDHPYRLHELIAPAGDISMKLPDFAKYTQLHLKGLRGMDGYIAATTFQYIHFAHKGFSLGVANTKMYGKIVTGFDGSAGTFYCRALIIPQDNIAFVIMINSGSQKGVNWMTGKLIKKYYNWWWR
jgi:CubicO group peptidase (beta-lactamase class C family)